MTEPADSTESPKRAELPLPESVRIRIEYLREGADFHYDLLKRILIADDANIFHVDLVVIAAMHRSMALIDGFTSLVEARNALAAVPLIRMEIDNVIRLYACWLVDEPPAVANALLDDRPLKKIKSRSGKPMTDRFLYEAAAEHYPWIPEVYRQTSGFVHLSGRHVFAPIKSVDHDNHSFTASFGRAREWTEPEMLEAVEAFIEATKALLHLCQSWLTTKEQGRMASEERARQTGIPLPDDFRKKRPGPAG